MSLTRRFLFKNCNHIFNITKPVRWNVQSNNFRVISSGICYTRTKGNIFNDPTYEVKRIDLTCIRKYACQNPCQPSTPPGDPEKKVGLIQKFKQMYRDYWYVLLPVHFGTSAVWFGSFYYAVRSGVDVIAILESMGVSEALLAPVKNSGAGYVALALALYKLATPLRYAVTVGGTTYAIKKLTAFGLIRPIPSRNRIKEMLQEKKGNFQDRFNESKQHYQHTMSEKRTQVMDEMRKYKLEMQKVKNKGDLTWRENVKYRRQKNLIKGKTP